MWRRPVLQIINAGGTNVLPGLSGLWKSCHVREQAGDESDTAEIVCVGPPLKFGLPKKGAEFTILGGWQDEGPVMQGKFTVQKINLRGEAETGEEISIQLRAADYVDKLKAHGTKHYDQETFGGIVKDLAKRAGLEAVVDEDLAKIKVPYRLWFNQSIIDFATELAEEHGARVKSAGGKLIAVKRGAGKSAGGGQFTPIEIRRRRGFAYDIEIEPRPEVGSVAASWHDEKTGKRKVAKHKTGRDGPIHMLPHPFRSEDEAKTAAESEAYEMGNNSGTGHFENPGLPHAHAEAPVTVSGFGFPIDGRWKAEGVEKVWDAEGGFTTTVEVKAGDDQKGKKG
jgi:phage protein D